MVTKSTFNRVNAIYSLMQRRSCHNQFKTKTRGSPLPPPCTAPPSIFTVNDTLAQPARSESRIAPSIPPHRLKPSLDGAERARCRRPPRPHRPARAGGQTKQTPVASRSKLIFQQPPSPEFTATVIRCCQQRRLCCTPVRAACSLVGLLVFFFYYYCYLF